MASSLVEYVNRLVRFVGKTKVPDLPPAWQVGVQDATNKALVKYATNNVDVELRGSTPHPSERDPKMHITARLRKKPPQGQEVGARIDTIHAYEDGNFISASELQKAKSAEAKPGSKQDKKSEARGEHVSGAKEKP